MNVINQEIDNAKWYPVVLTMSCENVTIKTRLGNSWLISTSPDSGQYFTVEGYNTISFTGTFVSGENIFYAKALHDGDVLEILME